MITKIKTFLFGRRSVTAPARTFIDILREYIEVYPLENDLEQSTIDHYAQRFRNIHLYLSSSGLAGIAIHEIRHRHIDDLYVWLKKTLATCTNRHASRHMELCRNVTKYALKKEYIIHDPLTSVEGKRDPKKKVITLTKDEVKRWFAYTFSNDKMQLAADLFFFQCATGLSYMDIWQYKIEEEAGIKFITNGRGKNDNHYSAELNQYAEYIIDKYSGDIPKLSNQKYNEKIKLIADLLKIDKHLTTHVGRKTFATLMKDNGYSLGSIKDMLGHKLEETTQTYYFNQSRERIINERMRLNAPDLLGTTA